jgi:citrate synthase
VREYLDAGLPLIGFGHPLYPDGDPRAKALLATLRSGSGAIIKAAMDLVDRVNRDTGFKPSVDFALALVARVHDLPASAPLCLFALGRTAGWIGHAIEQYSAATLIRPRARYVGPAPKEKL